MRISTHETFRRGVSPMLDHQSQLSDTQSRISTGKKFLTPSDDPITTARLMQLDKQIRLNDQYDRNIDFAESRLGLEETAIRGVEEIFQRARQLTIQADNATTSPEDREIIAQEIGQLRQQLVDIGNTKDAEGAYLFAGFSEHIKPFTTSPNGGIDIVYNGDQGQRLLKVGPSREVAIGDHGDDVFMMVHRGSEQIEAAPSLNNVGLGSIAVGGITDPSLYNANFIGHEYKIVFSNKDDVKDVHGTPVGNTFDVIEVTDGMENPVPILSGQTYTPGDPQVVSFRGVEVRLNGEMKVGDEFTVTTAQAHTMFEVFDRLSSALTMPVDTSADSVGLHQELNNVLVDFDESIQHVNLVLGRIGGRMNTLSAQSDTNQAANIRLKALSSKLGDVDYAEAATQLSEELLALQAAQASFAKIQALSLFDYLR